MITYSSDNDNYEHEYNRVGGKHLFPLLGLTRDLHPLDNARAEHTTQKPASSVDEVGFII